MKIPQNKALLNWDDYSMLRILSAISLISSIVGLFVLAGFSVLVLPAFAVRKDSIGESHDCPAAASAQHGEKAVGLHLFEYLRCVHYYNKSRPAIPL